MKPNWLTVILTIFNLILLIIVLVQARTMATRTMPDILRVRTFQLIDENDEVRAQFNVEEPNGEVVFRMYDPKGTIRVKLGASKAGSGLLLLNNLTEPGVHLLAGQDGSSLTLINPGGMEQVITP